MLVAALGIVLALLGFIKIAEEVLEGDMPDFDEWLLLLLRRPDNPHIPVGPQWLMEVAQDITALGGRTVLIIVILAAVGYLALERRHGAMWLVASAVGGGSLLSTAMKHLFSRGRPGVVPHLVAVTSPGFPSGHSMLVGVLYLTLGALLARFAARRRTKAELQTTRAAARTLGVALKLMEVRNADDLARVFAVLEKERPDALTMFFDAKSTGYRVLVGDFAKKYKIPTIFGAKEFAGRRPHVLRAGYRR